MLCLLQWPFSFLSSPVQTASESFLYIKPEQMKHLQWYIPGCTYVTITQYRCKLPLHNSRTIFMPFRDIIDLDTGCVHVLFPLTRPSWWAVVCLSCWEHFHKSQHANQHMASQATKDHQLTHASPTVSYLNTCHAKYEGKIGCCLPLNLSFGGSHWFWFV